MRIIYKTFLTQGVHRTGADSPRYGTRHTAKSLVAMSQAKIGGKNPMAKSVICEGEIYLSVKNCAIFYGVNAGTMRNWLNGCKRLPQLWKERGLAYYKGSDGEEC